MPQLSCCTYFAVAYDQPAIAVVEADATDNSVDIVHAVAGTDGAGGARHSSTNSESNSHYRPSTLRDRVEICSVTLCWLDRDAVGYCSHRMMAPLVASRDYVTSN